MSYGTSSAVEEWSRRRLALVLGGLMFAIILSALDQTIVSTALPQIASDLGNLQNLSWVVTSYLVTTTASTALYGKLSDIYGRKKLFFVAVAIFVVGSALCAFANSLVQLALLRALQGVGAGGLWSMVIAILGDMFGPRKRSEYISYMLSGFGAALVAGPLVGGWLTENVSWHWIFLINVPIGAIALFLVWRYLDVPQDTVNHPIDYLGAALLVAALSALILVTSWGGDQYAWDSTEILGLGIATVVLTVAFLVREYLVDDPVFPLHLLAVRGVAVAMGLSFVLGLAQFVGVIYLPLYLQAVTGASATNSGLLLLPLLGGMIVTSAITGQLISRFGRIKPFPVVGLAVAAVGYYLFSTMGPDTTFLTVAGFMLVTGVGLGFVNPVLSLSAQLAVDRSELGVATTSVSLTRSLGSGIGVAVMGTLFNEFLQSNLNDRLGPQAAAKAGGLAQNVGAIHELPASIQRIVVESLSQSLTSVFFWTIPIVVVGVVLAVLLPEADLDDGPGPGPEPGPEAAAND